MTSVLSSTPSISCQQTTVLVSLQRDNEIAPEQSRELTQHIAHCSSCQMANAQFKALFLTLDTLLCRAIE